MSVKARRLLRRVVPLHFSRIKNTINSCLKCTKLLLRQHHRRGEGAGAVDVADGEPQRCGTDPRGAAGHRLGG